MSTITAGDYTIEVPISKDNFTAWENQVYKVEGGPYESGIAPATAFKSYLIQEIESKMN